eukprot:CAMPEP_0170076872 /NCGR_PEP_ID=MMETSP0019_2-20121128/13804_1 /TAXON_ID=98059 /ORGANISM="Dinobryon sp., Strain UTEXLB2267" /LENGTH=332 /DNA_ID=CAMNT_0010288865 /DNA_START=123 /DNA_END=1121 /DNA_ORIENTATION=+
MSNSFDKLNESKTIPFGESTSFPESSNSKLQSTVSKTVKTLIKTAMASVAATLKPTKAFATDGPIVVVGSGGKTGKLIVEYLAKSGRTVRPTAREVTTKSASLFESLPKDNDNKTLVEPIVSADVTQLASLLNALKGASAVVFAASASRKGGSAQAVDYLGVENIAKACVELKIPRLVVISSGAITKPNSLGFKITNLFGGIMGYKLQGENALRAVYAANAANTDLSYVIIRPGGLLDGIAAGPAMIELNQGDTISGEVNRADVAQCAAAAAISKTLPRNVTFEMYESGRSGPLEGRFPAVSGLERKSDSGDYEVLFEGLKTDLELIAKGLM